MVTGIALAAAWAQTDSRLWAHQSHSFRIRDFMSWPSKDVSSCKIASCSNLPLNKLFIIYLLIYLCVCACVLVRTCTCVPTRAMVCIWRSEDNFEQLTLRSAMWILRSKFSLSGLTSTFTCWAIFLVQYSSNYFERISPNPWFVFFGWEIQGISEKWYFEIWSITHVVHPLRVYIVLRI